MLDYLNKLVKKYGWRFLILGGIGKMISLTCVVGIYGHWFAPALPDDAEPVEVFLHPDSVENHTALAQIKSAVNGSDGAGDRLARLIWRTASRLGNILLSRVRGLVKLLRCLLSGTVKPLA